MALTVIATVATRRKTECKRLLCGVTKSIQIQHLFCPEDY